MQSPSDTVYTMIKNLVLPPDSLDSMIQKAVESAVQQDDLAFLPYMVQILDTIIWPSVLLIILWAFKKEFVRIFEQMQSIKASASGFEMNFFESKMNEAASLANSVTSSLGISKSFAPPPDPDPFGPSDPKLKISKMQLDLDRKLRKKADAGGISVQKEIDIHNLNARLKAENLISAEEFQLVEVLSELAQGVHSGYNVTSVQAEEILNIYNKLP